MICQFCGKRISDGDTVCRYCGSDLTKSPRRTVSRYAGDDGNDETAVIPSQSKQTKQSYQSRPASRRAASGAGTGSGDNAGRSANDTRRARERGPEPKREYYRYDPNGDRRNVSRRRAANDRKAAPRYSKNPRGKKSVLKWIVKIILLAIVGIAVGILIYLGVNGITNFVKSIGNRDEAPSSVTTPVQTDGEKSDSAKDNSSNTDNAKQSESNTSNETKKGTDNSTEKGSGASGNTESSENRNNSQSSKSEVRSESESEREESSGREESTETYDEEGGGEDEGMSSERESSSSGSESGGENKSNSSDSELTD